MPRDRAKKFIWCIIFVMLVVAVGIFFLKTSKRTLQIPVSADQVESIFFYYDNEVSKKVIDTQKEIAAFLNDVEHAHIFGKYTYTHFPVGGLSFSIRFLLKDGTHYSCIYYQTGDIDGYFSDGVDHYRITSLDALTVWERLSFPAVRAHACEEFYGWPEL